MRATALSLLLFAAFAATGCARDGGDDAVARAGERRAALAYGEAAAAAKAQQEAFLAAWKASREAESVERLRATGRERVLPALARYLDALAAMPTESERIAALHARLVAAWRRFQGRLVGYYERVSEANLPKRNARLQAAWSELGARIVAYREQLRGLYDTLELRLPEDAAAGPER